MMEGDPLGSTTASPANPGLALVAGVTERKCKRGPHTSPTPATKRRPLWERERNERRTAAEERPPISTLTWLLLVGVLLPPGTYRVARARACVCVVLRHQQRVTYDEKMEGQQQAAAAAKQPLSGGGWAATAAASSYTSFYYFCTAMLAGGGCRGSTGCARVGDVALFRAAQ